MKFALTLGTPSTMQDVVDLAAIDWLVVLCYLLGLLFVILWINKTVGAADAEQYFLGGRAMPWWAIGCSLFASNVGTDHLVGLAGSGAATGLAVGMYEWNAAYILLILGFVFVPRYLAYEIYTVPEYLDKRFGRGLRTFFMIITLLATFFTKITVTIFAGAVVMEEVFGMSLYVSSISLLVLTAIYCTLGGLAAVMYTEVLQVGVLMVGCGALLYYGMSEVGGWQGLHNKLDNSYFQVMKPNSDQDFPWLGVFLGMPINSIWYWCTDQVMVQRALGTDQASEAQKGCVLASWMKVTPMYIMVLPGLIAAALYPTDMEEDSNKAFPTLVVRLMPPGFVGVMVAAMLSSFMAALASCFNSCSTLFTMDIYRAFRPDASEEALVLSGRIFTLFVALASLLWLPQILNSNEQLFLYIQSMQNIWCGPITTIFLASFVSPAVSTQSATVTLCCGLALGMFYWVVQNTLTESQLTGLPVLLWFHNLPILLYAPISCTFSTAVLLIHHLAERHVQENPVNNNLENRPLQGDEKQQRFNQLYQGQKWAGTPTRLSAAACLGLITSLVAYHVVTYS